jgi:hypothetical protein
MLESIGRPTDNHMSEEVLCLYALHELTRYFKFSKCVLTLTTFQACRDMWKMARCPHSASSSRSLIAPGNIKLEQIPHSRPQVHVILLSKNLTSRLNALPKPNILANCVRALVLKDHGTKLAGEAITE